MAEDLTEYVTSDDKICPHPWHQLYEIISKEAKARGVSEQVPVPLILAGWAASRDIDKRRRLIEQISYSEKYGFLDTTEKFLRSLSQDDWHKCPEELIDRPASLELSAQDWDEQQEIVAEAKQLYTELISVETNSSYEEGSFGSHMTSFSIVHDDLGIELTTYSEILKAKIKAFDDLSLSIDDFEKEYWDRDISFTKVTILKLELCLLCRRHEVLGGGGMFDFCEDIFID
jgi:hypothetical protein